ncbi:helix-turn-helix domain-containing protein [Polaribacter septentrionalilitoris]|uniref:helix-turn-helix domain-containing protein n=1 Tax=Polaribacter septentrionalilitoris TaxID=2494657 RepID=UPI001357332A|nr:helix-turn-helix domain-containing protein [Polaribacter septentrionalilitoris]
MRLIQVTPEELTTLVNDIFDSKFEILLNHLQPTTKTEYLSKKETSKLLGVSIGTLDNWSKNGILEPLYIGNRVLYTRQAIDNKLSQ